MPGFTTNGNILGYRAMVRAQPPGARRPRQTRRQHTDDTIYTAATTSVIMDPYRYHNSTTSTAIDDPRPPSRIKQSWQQPVTAPPSHRAPPTAS